MATAPSQVVEATVRCLARMGTAKLTAEDVATEARISRATLYRTFPGGKDALLRAVVDAEVTRLCSALGAAMGAADDLEDMLVAGILTAARAVGDHPAVAYLLSHEPGVVLPHLTFGGLERLLAAAGGFCAPYFSRWLEPDDAARAAEWAARIAVSYFLCPSARVRLDDPAAVRRLVRTYVVPGIDALCGRGGSRELAMSHPGERM